MSTKQYLYKVSILNRQNSNPVEAAAYYMGESQIGYASNTSENVIWNHLCLPKKTDDKYFHLPQFLKGEKTNKQLISNLRTVLWQQVLSREVRDDAQFARLFEVLMPSYLEKSVAVDAMKKFADFLQNEGMIVDCSIHKRKINGSSTSLYGIINQEPEKEHNIDYTGFLMCTLRDYKNGLFINKNRTWNDRKKMESWRKEWVKILALAVHSSNHPEKSNWDEKLTIYSEYSSIKSQLIQDGKITTSENQKCLFSKSA